MEGVAALPESTNSTLAPLINFLVINRRLAVWVGRRLGLFVARCCSGFHAVKVAQKVAQRGAEVECKKLKTPFLLRFFGRARGGIGRRAGFRIRFPRE